MTKTFDGVVDGKHVQRWQPTEEEKVRALEHLEEIRKKHSQKKLLPRDRSTALKQT